MNTAAGRSQVRVEDGAVLCDKDLLAADEPGWAAVQRPTRDDEKVIGVR
jgi:hypothetical protein